MAMELSEIFIKHLMEQNTSLLAQTKSQEEQIESLTEQIESLTKQIGELTCQIRELTEQKNKNSKNSSKPPSSDGLKKPNKNKSLREASDKKVGAQQGHSGNYLAMMRKPDKTIPHMHCDCENCAMREQCFAQAKIESRHEVDAQVEVHITEHQKVLVTDCPLHGGVKEGEFPDDIKAAIQYGNNLQALVVALNTVGAVSINRTHEILSSVFNVPIATGTIKNMVTRCAAKLSGTYDHIRNTIKKFELLHCDETGTRVDGKNCWVHDASNPELTFLSLSDFRGEKGISEAGVLPEYTGTIVHDCWSSYWKYSQLRHAVCCAHLLRELNGVIENHPDQTWAEDFKLLLLAMKETADEAICAGLAHVNEAELAEFMLDYDELIQLAHSENPLSEKKTKGKKGRTKKTTVQNLIDRLEKYKESVCLFVKDLTVPFDNNQAERDLRMIKVKTKVSGCFRSKDGAKEYLTIMSYIGSAHKQGINSHRAICEALAGNSEFIFAGLTV